MTSQRRGRVSGSRHSAARAKTRGVVGRFVEQLEDRRLLTAIFGGPIGDVFNYQQAPGQLVRISTTGNAMFEAVGSVVDDQNNLILTDLPGTYQSSGSARDQLDALGGIGGGNATRTVGGSYNFPLPPGGNAQRDYNVQALASNTAGDTYGINWCEIPAANDTGQAVRYVQFVRFDTATGGGTIGASPGEATLRDDVAANVTGVTGVVGDVAIDPTTGLVYVLTEDGRLYTMERNTGAVIDETATLVGIIRNGATQLTAVNLRAMAFSPTGQLYILTTNYDNNPNADASGGATGPAQDTNPAPTTNNDLALIAINKATATFTNANVRVIQSLNAQDNTWYEADNQGYFAMVFDRQDPNTVLAVELPLDAQGGGGGGGGNQVAYQLTSIDITTGNATPLGDLGLDQQGGGGGGGGNYIPDRVDGLAWAVDAGGANMLVGIDNGIYDQNGNPHTALIQINPAAPDQSVQISSQDGPVPAQGLASFTEPGATRPLLWTYYNGQLIRGSCVTLPMDAESGSTAAASVRAADFNPVNGLLYFVVELELENVQPSPQFRLYSMDMSGGSAAVTQNSLTYVTAFLHTPQGGGQQLAPVIESIAFDQTNMASATLVGYASDSSGNMLVSIPFVGNTAGGQQYSPPILMDGQPIGNITGLAFYGDDPYQLQGEDPTRAEVFVYAVQNLGANSNRILRIRRVNTMVDPSVSQQAPPTAMIWGNLTAQHQGNRAGDNIQGLTWNPTMINPYTFEVGALLGTDQATRSLVVIDQRLRSPTISLFNIHFVQADIDSVVTISRYYDNSAPAADRGRVAPFEGDAGTIRIVNTQGQSQVVNTPANSGVVYLGSKTNNVDCVGTGNEDLRPILPEAGTDTDILQGLIPYSWGMLNVASGYLPVGVFAPMSGIMETLTDPSTRMIGSNLDKVEAASFAADGTLAVIDTDRCGPTGGWVPGDQIALKLPNSATATNVANIVDSLGNPLHGVIGIDWADPDGDGIQSLYAIYSIGGVPTLGVIDANPASPTYGTFTATTVDLTVGGAIGGVQAMTFSPFNQHLYIVSDDGRLYQFRLDPANPMTGAIYAGPLVSGLPTIKSMDFNALGRLVAHDIQNARLIDINTGSFGTEIATPEGSVRASIGAIAYNPATGQLMAVDNALSREYMEQGLAAAENLGAESAMLLQILSVSAAQATPQNLGKFFFAGTLTGQVQVTGSIKQFYAGCLLTGATGGSGTDVPVPSNFHAGGDIRELDVLTSIGTNDASAVGGTAYRTGFELTAGGRVGQIKVGTDVVGAAYVTNNIAYGLPIDTVQQDLEPNGTVTQSAGGTTVLSKTVNVNVTAGVTTGDRFVQGFLSNPVFFNDTFATAQYLGTIASVYGQNVVRVFGSVSGSQSSPDVADFYGVSLLAGQSVMVQLMPQQGGQTAISANVGVFDPDGRLIATDISDIDANQYYQKPFTFTADRPGVYRFAIGSVGDGTFNGNAGTGNLGAYELRITASTDGTAAGPGDIALGAVVAGRTIFDGRSEGSQFTVGRGDLGAIAAGAFFASTSTPTVLTEDNYGVLAPQVPYTREEAMVGATIDVLNGNMRSIDCASVGYWNTNPESPTLGVDIHAINGAVGLIRSTGTGANDTLYLNDGLASYGVPRVSDHDTQGVARQVAVGGDVQLVSSATQYTGAILTNTRIGVVRAATMPYGYADTFFVANADQQGYDGTIDLIYSEGDIGSQSSAGPAIITGPGGNLRYMYAGGIVWRDPYFGLSNDPEETLFQPGEPATFTDDSGAYVTISTAAPPRTAAGATPSSLHVTTYGVRGSGGVAIVRVRADGYTTNSINISGSSFSPLSGVEIGQIALTGAGQAPVAGTDGRLTLPTIAAGEIPLFLQIGGTANVDVFSVTGENIYSLINATGGEVVNVDATTIGRLEAGYVGLAKHYTSTAVNGLAIRANNYPFVQQRMCINSGDIAMVIAKHAIGNINSTGTVGQVIADSDRIHDWWEYDGIVAPIYAGGELQDVSIGQGITSSGNGMLAHSGLYAVGAIGTVRGNGDIRGSIVSTSSIGRIALTGGGSIINVNIGVFTDLAMGREFLVTGLGRTVPNNGTPFTRPTFQIGSITIQGAAATKRSPALNGGIIGVFVVAGHIGPVNVRNGFGVIDSFFGTLGDGVFQGITTDGYGIRDVTIQGGAVVNNLIAKGNGANIPVSSYSYQLRQSEFAWQQYDYRRGLNDWSPHFEPNRTTDLAKYMGTTAANPSMPFDAVTSSGVIAGTDVRVSRKIDQVKAWSVRPSDRTTSFGYQSDTDPVTGTSLYNWQRVDTPYYIPSVFHAANKLTYFDITGPAIDLEVNTGSIKRMSIGGDMIGPSITVAGLFSTLKIQGHLVPTALQEDYQMDCIQVIGGNAELTSLYVGGGVNLPITVQRKLGKWTVLGKNSPFGRFGPRGKIMLNSRRMAP